jgi:hypothetical protein
LDEPNDAKWIQKRIRTNRNRDLDQLFVPEKGFLIQELFLFSNQEFLLER